MLVRFFGCAAVLLAFVVSATPGEERPAVGLDDTEIAGKIKEVDLKKKAFTIAVADKGDQTFLVNRDTKFTGPRGGNREDGLKDECMDVGYDVKVVPAADAKVAKEVKLSASKGGGGGKGKKKGG